MTGSRPSQPLRVAIVNDFEIVVNGVARMLAEHPDRVHVIELDNRLPVVSDVDVILFDAFGFLAHDGINLADLVGANGAKVAVYSWTTHPDAVGQALALGASGYLSKALSTVDLIEALETIHGGETVISPALEAPENQVGGWWPGRDQGLTPRESEILSLIALGLTNREIAGALFLSVNSVKTHIRNAYRTIQVERRSQAVAWALQHGFARAAHREVPVGDSEHVRHEDGGATDAAPEG